MEHLAWDIDDTLGDCALAWITWLHKHGYGEYTHEHFQTYRLSETFKCSDSEAMKRLSQFLESDELDNMVAYPQAAQIMRSLKHVQHHAVTGRPLSVKPVTRRWLDRHFPGQITKLYTVGKEPHSGATPHGNNGKALACQELGAKALVEDAPMFVDACLDSGIQVILVAKPWNRQYTRQHPLLHQAKDLTQVEQILSRLV
jgi:hypothetical protein